MLRSRDACRVYKDETGVGGISCGLVAGQALLADHLCPGFTGKDVVEGGELLAPHACDRFCGIEVERGDSGGPQEEEGEAKDSARGWQWCGDPPQIKRDVTWNEHRHRSAETPECLTCRLPRLQHIAVVTQVTLATCSP